MHATMTITGRSDFVWDQHRKASNGVVLQSHNIKRIHDIDAYKSSVTCIFSAALAGQLEKYPAYAMVIVVQHRLYVANVTRQFLCRPHLNRVKHAWSANFLAQRTTSCRLLLLASDFQWPPLLPTHDTIIRVIIFCYRKTAFSSLWLQINQATERLRFDCPILWEFFLFVCFILVYDQL